MKKLFLAGAFLLGLAGGAHACNVPNPNLLAGVGGQQFVDNCPLPAVALNRTTFLAGAVATDALSSPISISKSSILVSSDGTLPDSLIGANVNYNTLSAVAHNIASSTLTNLNAVAGYVLNDNPGDGSSKNSVALYGWGKADVAGSWVWGVNGITISKSGLGGSATHQTGAEFDVDGTNTTDLLIGVTVSGGSTAVPAAATGYLLTPAGTGVPWNVGFLTLGGSASLGIQLGQLAASGVNVNSQPEYLQFFDAGGLSQSYILQASPGSLNFTSTATPAAYQFNGSVIIAGGTNSLFVGGDVTLSNVSHGLALGTASAITSITIGNAQAGTKVAINGNAFVPSVTTTAALTSCSSGADAGKMYIVTDATAPTYGGTLAGSGAVYALVICNGSAWKTL